MYGWLPSASASSTPVTVTVCGDAQFSCVNTRLVTSTVPSVASLESKLTVTMLVGSDVNRTVNVAEPPPSVVGPLIGLTMMPALSSSMLITSTFGGRICR